MAPDDLASTKPAAVPFEHYRLRVLLRSGKPTWPNRPTPPILRTCRPHAHA